MGHERRQHNRTTSLAGTSAQLRRPVSSASLSVLSREDQRHSVVDLSLSGAFIAAPHPPPGGSLVDVVLWSQDNRPLTVKAEVRRAEVGHGMGVRFVEMNEETSSRLRGYFMASRVRSPSTIPD